MKWLDLAEQRNLLLAMDLYLPGENHAYEKLILLELSSLYVTHPLMLLPYLKDNPYFIHPSFSCYHQASLINLFPALVSVLL